MKITRENQTFFFAAMQALLVAATTGALLLDCNDQGPWPCTVEGCPDPLISCTLLSELAFCSSPFAEIWAPPPSGTADALIHERCPRACGRCGVDSTPECNMPTLDANKLGPAALAEALGRADAPVVIRGTTASWPEYTYARLLAQQAEVKVTVVLEGGTRRGEAARWGPNASFHYLSTALSQKSVVPFLIQMAAQCPSPSVSFPSALQTSAASCLMQGD